MTPATAAGSFRHTNDWPLRSKGDAPCKAGDLNGLRGSHDVTNDEKVGRRNRTCRRQLFTRPSGYDWAPSPSIQSKRPDAIRGNNFPGTSGQLFLPVDEERIVGASGFGPTLVVRRIKIVIEAGIDEQRLAQIVQQKIIRVRVVVACRGSPGVAIHGLRLEAELHVVAARKIGAADNPSRSGKCGQR